MDVDIVGGENAEMDEAEWRKFAEAAKADMGDGELVFRRRVP